MPPRGGNGNGGANRNQQQVFPGFTPELMEIMVEVAARHLGRQHRKMENAVINLWMWSTVITIVLLILIEQQTSMRAFMEMLVEGNALFGLFLYTKSDGIERYGFQMKKLFRYCVFCFAILLFTRIFWSDAKTENVQATAVIYIGELFSLYLHDYFYRNEESEKRRQELERFLNDQRQGTQ